MSKAKQNVGNSQPEKALVSKMRPILFKTKKMDTKLEYNLMPSNAPFFDKEYRKKLVWPATSVFLCGLQS